RGADDELQASAADAARGQLQRAAELDPSYPDPRCFLAVVAANQYGDEEVARQEGEQCLALDPPGQLAQFVEPFLAELTASTTTG
ncbi:MAG: hypothetical protein ACR2HP_11260, partial [Ilumatobacteraceae bacterium]